MLSKTKATIYLADQRGCSQEDWFRSFHIFNAGKYFNENRRPFGNLNTFNDTTLKSGHTLVRYTKEETVIMLLPVVGALNVRIGNNDYTRTDVGEVFIVTVPKDSIVEIVNPYEDDLINFLEIWYTIPSSVIVPAGKVLFDLDNRKDILIPLSLNAERDLHTSSCIGKFSGRGEGIYTPTGSSHGVFVFVLEGAFEVANRLLHARDGLALYEVEAVDFEALSNNAIIMFMEVKID
jgi:redox-sensitive bicupin YhaK (pirin superfamily)